MLSRMFNDKWNDRTPEGAGLPPHWWAGMAVLFVIGGIGILSASRSPGEIFFAVVSFALAGYGVFRAVQRYRAQR